MVVAVAGQKVRSFQTNCTFYDDYNNIILSHEYTRVHDSCLFYRQTCLAAEDRTSPIHSDREYVAKEQKIRLRPGRQN